MTNFRFLLKNVVTIVACFAGCIIFSGCGDKEKESSNIEVQTKDALTQEMFADETGAKSVTFVTAGAWTSTITGASKSLRSGATVWISISPESGDKAGTHTISINLEPNDTGNERAAVIIISCNGTDITISVTQKATKEDGTLYEKPESGAFDGKITAKVENASEADNANVSKVQALLWDDNIDDDVVIASGSYANGNFTLTLPQTVSNNLLENVEDRFGDPEVEISDKKANIAIVWGFYYYDGDDKRVGSLDYEKGNIYAFFVYADKDVTVTGRSSDNDIYNMSLKKGWNIVYDNPTSIGKKGYTTQSIDGLKWYFYKDDDDIGY